ncbi:MAG: S41 family peptidase [Planctomycetota bacterium]
MEPANGAVDLDAQKTKKLVVIFDQPMSDRAWSFCGGGPGFPPFKGKPRWDTPKKIVVDVELEPDHEYSFSLNCPSATNFQSGKGVPLEPVAWTFATAPAKLPSAARQKAGNEQALDQLKSMLPERYSYFDRRVSDWSALYEAHEGAILAARTTRGWATAVAKMLAMAEDLHLFLRLGEQTFATSARAIDPHYRAKLLPRYVPVSPAGKHGLVGRTDDGLGYVMIAAWSDPTEIDAIETALASLRDCKALVVDVRPNSGGDELLARRVAAWFVEGTKVYAKNRSREKAGPDGFGATLERALTGNTEPARQLAQPIALLTSRYVMSSNESFVLMMRQARDCTVVGERTYGSSGNPKPLELSNGVTIFVPSWQDLRLDGTCFEGEGIAPDIEVVADAKDFEDSDPILDRALALLRSKVR